MYRTQSVILNRKKQSVICSYFDEWSLTSKAIYNSALFIERQLVSSSGKSEGMYSENENDASIFIGQVKHLEFDLIRNQSH